MKIIKEGKLPEDNEVEFTCYNCNSVLSFKIKEVRRDSKKEYITCLFCKKEIVYMDFSSGGYKD